MQAMTFEELQIQIQSFYQDGDFDAALDLANEQFEHFSEHSALLYYWRITMSARIGDLEGALTLLAQALESGNWFSDTLLRKSPSLEELQELGIFEQLVERNRALREQDQKDEYPIFTLRPQGKCLGSEEACPLLLALHANASTAQGSMSFWRPAALAGWLVAAPQSGQALFKGANVWDDYPHAAREVVTYLSNLKRQYNVDGERIVLAGHSMGAEISLRMALSGEINARGFVALYPEGPFMDDPPAWETTIRNGVDRNLRGVMIIGENDATISHEGALNLAERLTQAGLRCEVEIIGDAGHDFTERYEAVLLQALEFILDG